MYHTFINSKFVRWLRARHFTGRMAGWICLSGAILAVVSLVYMSRPGHVDDSIHILFFILSMFLVLWGVVMLVLRRWLKDYALLGSVSVIVAILGAVGYHHFSKVRAGSQDSVLI